MGAGVRDDMGPLMHFGGGVGHEFCRRGCRKRQAGNEKKACSDEE